jgi:hypothetical protein
MPRGKLVLAAWVFVAGLGWFAPEVQAQSAQRSAVGTWRSQTGNVFVVPNSATGFNLGIHQTNGQQLAAPAQWVQGMIGVMFMYQSGNQWATCTYNHLADQIRVQAPNGVTFWTRVK